MVRKSSCYILFGLLLLIPGYVFSLGLGEIEVDSALNQPLQAQINLISARAEELEEMRVELAPADVFDRVGVPRPYFLTQLKFQPVSLPGGRTAIRVTSKDPVREPFLTFLVEITWPKGRLLREYTVLLDPPELAQQRAPQISTPVVTQPPVTEEIVVEPAPQISTVPEVAAEPVVTAPEVAAEPVSTAPAEPVVTESAEDIDAIRAQMDRALGIDDSEPVVTAAEPVDTQPEIVEAEPSAEELEESVVEETQEVVSETVEEDVIVPEDVPGSDAVEETETVEVVDAEPAAEIDSQAAIANEYTTAKGDTLFTIAKTARGSTAMTVNQMMLAIQQANSDAFINDNINLLKSGVVLRIPDGAAAETVNKAQATAEISRQNALWREYRAQVTEKMVAANVDAPDLVEEEKTSAGELASEAKQALKETEKKATPPQQDLNIMAGEDAKQTGTGSTQLARAEELEKMQKELTLSNELVQSREKENDDLKSRVEALESMLEKKDKIINIQSEQLSDIKKQLDSETIKAKEAEKLLQEKSTSETLAESKQETPAPQTKVEEIKPPVVDEPSPELKAPVQAEQTISTPKLAPLPDWDSLPDIEIPAEQEVVAEATPAEEEATAKPVEEPKQPEATPEPAETTTETGIMATVMGLIEPLKKHAGKGALGLAVLAVLGGLYSWRQRRSARRVETIGLGAMPEALEDDQFDDILDETIVTPQDAPVKASEPSEEVSFEPTASFGTEAETTTEEEAASPDDVLEEADVYISYGLHQQAQDLLTDAIAAEPNRKDYKVKLAEVFYSSKDQAAFEQHAQSIKDHLGESSSEWQNIIVMGKEIAPTSALFAGATAVGMAANIAAEKPDVADVDIGLQTGINQPVSDDELEDTVVDNNTNNDDEGLDFNLDTTVAADAFDDDPVASKIMEANETSDILNFEVDDLADDFDDAVGMDTDIEAAATGIHEATGIHKAAELGDLTEELDEVGMQTTMDDLKPLDMDEPDIGDTAAFQPDDDFDDTGLDTAVTPDDPDATAAYVSNSLDQDNTEQFDASNIDTEFLDPAEATVAQTATDLHELGPPSLIEEVGTKLDLAKAFVDMGDSDAAKETLIEVISEGDESQVKAAKDLMDKLGG